ncbi:MAG: cobalamin-dependent protein, partial [Desulfitobacteriaceae bacterium]|nr:cobalamin-dependent protein [Desulfitobacteriaceae bacterium]
ITHPGEIFAALKFIGPEQLETHFGVGKSEKTAMRGRVPIRPTDMIKTITQKRETVFEKIQDVSGSLSGMKVIVGTTDIHDYGKEIVKAIALKAGADVFDLGTYATPGEIIETVIETESRAILISTYNGIALSYAKELVEGLRKKNLDAKLILGGLINENQDGGSLAVDVTDAVRALGVNCDNNPETIVDTIRSIYLSN